MSKFLKKKRFKPPSKTKKIRKLVKSYMVTNKDSLSNIIKNVKSDNGRTIKNIIIDAVNRAHKIIIHTNQFLKYLLIFLHDQSISHPGAFTSNLKIDVQLIRTIMNKVSFKNEDRGKPALHNKTTVLVDFFYQRYYSKTIKKEDIVSRDLLKHVLNYEEQDIIKNISTNISEHFVSHLKFYIRIFYKVDEQIASVRKNKKLTQEDKEKQIKCIKNTHYNIFKDIMSTEKSNFISDEEYHENIKIFRITFLPPKNKFLKNSIHYDVVAKPLDYVNNMIAINKAIETINAETVKNCKPGKSPQLYRLFNAIPLRTSIIPKYITIDTAALLALFTVENKSYNMRNIPKIQHAMWNKYFKLNKKSFKRNGFKFNYMIKTDGIGASIIMVQTDNKGNPIVKPSIAEQKYYQNSSQCKYIDEIKPSILSGYNISPGDPGHSDITFGKKDPKTGKITTLKFTRNQRNIDIKNAKYNKIRKKQKTEVINGKTITELESELSKYDHKTCDIINFFLYIGKKNKINRLLFNHYGKNIYRKLRFNTYINSTRSEDNMINKFKEIMGTPEQTIVAIGDYSNKSLKGTKPAITSKWRKIFIKHGYQVYLTDEYNTSKISSCCGDHAENFLPREHKNWKEKRLKKIAYEKRSGKKSLVWKLVRCKICKSIHNRDVNAVKNMFKIIEAHLKGSPRPKRYCPKEEKKEAPGKKSRTK